MTDEQQRFLSRADVEYLRDQLDALPEIEQDLAIALTAEIHVAPSGSGRRTQPRSRPPYPIHLEALRDELKAELVAAVRDICETRGLTYDGADTITGCGAWLTRNRFALQLMDSGVKTFELLCKIINRSRRTLGYDDVAPLAPAEKSAARVAFVSLSTIEAVARRCGEYELTRKRLRWLAEREFVVPVNKYPDGTLAYRLGDVLDAHRDAPSRRRARP